MSTPFFSIVLPAYNRSAFIAKAISSVLAQTFQDFELIIIDDGSTDNTKDVVSSFSDPRLFYYYQVNQERSVARNNGISRSKGTYICFLDSDDYYFPEHLSVLRENIVEHGTPIAFFHTYQKYLRGGTEECIAYNDHYSDQRLSDTDCRLINNVWLFSPAIQTAGVHREILSVIRFDTYPIPFECYELVGRIAATHRVIKINKRTVVMQLHESNSTVYDKDFLERSRSAFSYILENPIYKGIREHFSVKDKFCSIYIGLADCYSHSGDRIVSMRYLLKAMSFKRDFTNARQILGIIKNLFYRWGG